MNTVLIQVTGRTIDPKCLEAIREELNKNPDTMATIVWYDESQKEQVKPGQMVYKQHVKPLKETEQFLYELIRDTSR